MPRLRIGVVEARWEERRNRSIKPLFDVLSELYYSSTHEYEYEMPSTRESFAECVKRLAGKAGIDVLYVAAHGARNSIQLHGRDAKLTADDLVISLRDANRTRSNPGISGLFLGTCQFGTEKVAETLLSNVPRLQWVAGYNSDIDFIESSALDLLFFNDLLKRRGTPDEKIRRVATYFRKNVARLCARTDVGFSIYVRNQGEVSDLLSV